MSNNFDVLEDTNLLDILKEDPETVSAANADEGGTGIELSSINNEGSGDIQDDLVNWFNGVDAIPSNPLRDFTSSTALKTDIGLKMSTLNNFSMMNKVKKFLEEAMDFSFESSTLINLEPADLENKIRTAFNIYKDLYTLNQRSLQIMREMKLKGVETEEVDEMALLLSSISDSTLKGVLEKLNETDKV